MEELAQIYLKLKEQRDVIMNIYNDLERVEKIIYYFKEGPKTNDNIMNHQPKQKDIAFGLMNVFMRMDKVIEYDLCKLKLQSIKPSFKEYYYKYNQEVITTLDAYYLESKRHILSLFEVISIEIQYLTKQAEKLVQDLQ